MDPNQLTQAVQVTRMVEQPDSRYLSVEATEALAAKLIDLLATRGLTTRQAVAVLAVAYRNLNLGELELRDQTG